MKAKAPQLANLEFGILLILMRRLLTILQYLVLFFVSAPLRTVQQYYRLRIWIKHFSG